MLNVNNLIGFNNNSNTPVYVGGVFYGSTSSNGGSPATISLSGTLVGGIDTSPRSDDVVVIAYSCSGITNRDTSIVTAGYTVLTDLYSDDTRDCNLGISWKMMGITPDTSVQIRGSAANTYGTTATIQVWRNLKYTPAVNKITTATGQNSALAAPPALTPELRNSVIIAVWACTGSDAQVVFTSPTTMENVVKDRGNGTIGGQDNSLMMASAIWYGNSYTPPAGTGVVTSTSDSWASATLSIS